MCVCVFSLDMYKLIRVWFRVCVHLSSIIVVQILFHLLYTSHTLYAILCPSIHRAL